MAEPDWILYGANGFTGMLAAERAKAQGRRPILAGRDPGKIEPLARRLDLPHRIFSLDSPKEIEAALAGTRLVLHCAGPYSATSAPMLAACLAARVSYLDLTGEYAVIEAVLARDDEARRAGIVVMPAVGFDVVPTDCMAAKLHSALPDASELELGFGGSQLVPSPGTAKTTVEGLHVGPMVRRQGQLEVLDTPLVREIPFARGERPALSMSIPWGDLVSAYVSTGIPNITVYAQTPRSLIRGAKLLRFARPLLRSERVKQVLKRQVETRATGPTPEERRTARMWIWGRAANPRGVRVEAHLEVPEGYELTVSASLEISRRVLSGEVDSGAQTPSKALGADFVTTLPGVGPWHLHA